MREIINSVGIDIGTSTTQLIFSKLTIENLASSYTVPRISIVDKEVVYKSDIYFTPLIDATTIDSNAILNIVKDEYKKAHMLPENLNTGAVIITGETARKENANEVLSALSHMAGDFVVATAGPDLESVLSARGAGTDSVSKEERNVVANIDIGGGTSNIAVFEKGNLVATSCLDIGGRLIKVKDGKITYIYEKIAQMCKDLGLNLAVGDKADVEKISKLCNVMAEELAMALGLAPKSSRHKSLYTNDGEPIKDNIKIDGVTFSGGVADIIYNPTDEDPFRYYDIGPILGKAIRNCPAFHSIKIYDAVETIRATVVGAGTHTTEVSGSTIRYEADCLPIKNVPVVRMTEDEEDNLQLFSKNLTEKIDVFTNRSKDEKIAIALGGKKYTAFDKIQELASAIIAGIKSYDNPKVPIIVVVEKDIGKVLGNALKVMLLEQNRKVICIDSIFVKDGDYIDIGEPVANGRVVPVVTKTLIFNH